LKAGWVVGLIVQGEDELVARLEPLGDRPRHRQEQFPLAVAHGQATEPTVPPAFDPGGDDTNQLLARHAHHSQRNVSYRACRTGSSSARRTGTRTGGKRQLRRPERMALGASQDDVEHR